MTKTTINGIEFNIGTAAGCEQAKEHVSAHIAGLEEKKGEVAAKLEASFLGFQESQALRTALQETEKELLHFGRLLQRLGEKHSATAKTEEIAAAQEEIARVEKQTAALATLCEKEIPPASRKLAVIAAALQRNLDERQRMADRAEQAGLDAPEMPDPLQRLAGDHAFASRWLRHLHLPVLDEMPDRVTFWPLPDTARYTECYQDNPKIGEDVEEILSAEDMLKALKALSAKIDKRKFTIREVENVESHIIRDYSKPLWFERPRGEWPKLLAPNPVTACVRQLGDKVRFWLELPEPRKFCAFIHLLDPEERERAMEQTPEEERRKYLDHLMEYASNDMSDEDDEPLEAAG